MLIAHAPAGYLLARFLSRTIFRDSVDPRRSDRFYQTLIAAGMIGSILPDFDFIYHLFIDSDRTPHHSYMTHMPVFWILLTVVLAGIGRWRKCNEFIATVITGGSSALLHLVCDTATGVIYWFFPFSKQGLNIFAVSDVHIWWVHNFMYHWTFLFEIAIVVTAMIIFLRIRETVLDLVFLLRTSPALRSVTLRIGVCVAGLGIIMAVGAIRFDVDKYIYRKAVGLKQRIILMVARS